jgi:N-acetylmuramoyl-L-alanine amidase
MKSIQLFKLPAKLTSPAETPKKSRKLNGKLFKAFSKHKLTMVIAAHVLVITGLGYGAVKGSEKPAVQSSLSNVSVSSDTSASTVDQVSSAEIASRVALMTSAVEAISVVNQSDSLNIQNNFGSGSTYLTKPQIIEGGGKSKRDIVNYKTNSQDSVSSLATKFSVSADTIRWANNLQGEIIGADKDIVIPPVSGVLYTPETLSSKYKADKEAIIKFNDAETSGLVIGDKIVIPGGVVPAPIVPIYTYASIVRRTGGATSNVPATASTIVSPPSNLPSNPISGGGFNGYATGYCTWHAANRRIQIGRPVPPFMGNARQWVSSASSSGYSVGDTPVAGGVVWHSLQYGLGHVAFLEQVYADGSMLISDMNYNGNWNRVTYRTEPASNARLYKFIY